MKKTLDNTNTADTIKKVSDVKIVGNPDLFRLLCKASSEKEGWMKSTKAMTVGSEGSLVQVTTQQRNLDGSYAIAEALTFVPNVMVKKDTEGNFYLGSF